VQRQAHDPPVLGAFAVERVELVPDHRCKSFAFRFQASIPTGRYRSGWTPALTRGRIKVKDARRSSVLGAPLFCDPRIYRLRSRTKLFLGGREARLHLVIIDPRARRLDVSPRVS
jgi:hypothetical protein